MQKNADVECGKLTQGGIDALSVEVLMKRRVAACPCYFIGDICRTRKREY